MNPKLIEKIHKFLYRLTRTLYGRKHYGVSHNDQVEFSKCYWFPKIAASYLIKYHIKDIVSRPITKRKSEKFVDILGKSS
jgi:hypothetical protein